MDRRRFPGARSFEEPDSGRFFGRTRATDELLLRVLSVRLLLQFAPSGAGKTSLLNAGLYPKLRPHAYLPVNVRLNQPTESLVAAVTRSLKEAAHASELKDPKIPEGAESVWGLLSDAQFWSADLMLLTPVLVFDQFEEVFTLRDEKFREGFAREIGELTRGRHALTSPDQVEEDAPNVKVIISLREEYLGALEEMTVAIPDLFRERLRLVPLADAEAREAIVEPARLAGDWTSPQFEFTPACLDGLVDFIDGVSEKIRVIETLTLQLVCQRAEELATLLAASRPKLELTLEDFGGMNGLQGLVRNYYNGVLDKLPDHATRRHAVEMFERGLLDPSGKRLMLEQDAIARQFKLSEAALGVLVDRRLLRREPRNESIFYEISHDRLTDVIARHRSTPLPAWVRPTLWGGAALIVMLGIFLTWVLNLKEKAEISEQATAQALSVLFGNELTVRLHDAGLTDAYSQVLKEAPEQMASDPLAQARRHRLQGDLAWERGTIVDAEQSYLLALDAIDDAEQNGVTSPELSAERAQVLKCLGDVDMDQGEVARAQSHYQEAVNDWKALDDARNPMIRLYAIQAQNGLVSVWKRMGDLDRAEAGYKDIAQRSLGVLTEAFHQTADQEGRNSFVLSRALQAHVDAMMSLARVWFDFDELKSVRSIALESLRLRPFSSEARVQLGVASATYGGSTVHGAEGTSARYLEESDKQFRELTQHDPLNLRMRRESAAVKLVSADGIAGCAADPNCRTTQRPAELASAESLTLDAIGVFEELAKLDGRNRGLQTDIAWAKHSQAKLRSLSGNYVEALKLVDEAFKLVSDNLVDTKDNEFLTFEISLMETRARILGDSGRHPEALEAFEKALQAAGKLPSSVWRSSMRASLLDKKAELLRAMKQSDTSIHEIQAEVATLRKTLNDRAESRKELARKLNAEGVELFAHAKDLEVAERLAGYDRAAVKYREALAQAPGEAEYWGNLSNVCSDTASSLINRNGEAISTDFDDPKRVESALRCAAESSWLATVLSGDDADNATLLLRLGYLYEDRRKLSMVVANDKNRIEEALALAEESVRDAEALVARDTSPNSLHILAESHYDLGYMRAESGHGGWEVAMRAAIARAEQIRAQQPKDFPIVVWIGEVRAALAHRLQTHSASTFVEEGQHAREMCELALTLAKTPERVKRSQTCIDDAQTLAEQEPEKVVPAAGS